MRGLLSAIGSTQCLQRYLSPRVCAELRHGRHPVHAVRAVKQRLQDRKVQDLSMHCVEPRVRGLRSSFNIQLVLDWGVAVLLGVCTVLPVHAW